MRKQLLIISLLLAFSAVILMPKSVFAETKCYIKNNDGSYQRMPTCEAAILALTGFNLDGMDTPLGSGCYSWTRDASQPGTRTTCALPAIQQADTAAIFGEIASSTTGGIAGVVLAGASSATSGVGAVATGGIAASTPGSAASASNAADVLAGGAQASSSDSGSSGGSSSTGSTGTDANDRPVDFNYTKGSSDHPCGAPPKSTKDPAQVSVAIDIGCQGKGNPILDAMFAIIRFLSLGVGMVVIGSIIVAGIQYTGSRGDPQATAKAIERITSSILALALYIFAYALLNWLIPAGLLK